MPRSYSAVHIHLIFATKGRRPFLADEQLRKEVHAYLGGISHRLDCRPILIGGVEDHVHVLASLGKQMSQAELVKELKRVSSIWVKEREPSLAHFGWQGGYGSYSVGHDDLGAVERYIANQAEHHKKETLEEEFLRFLIEHGMQWDPRDSWDE